MPTDDPDASLAIAAVTLLAGGDLDGEQLGAALADLAEAERPDLVRVVDEIPVTTWYRPNAAALRAAGAPAAGEGVWRREGDAYVGPAEPAPSTPVADTIAADVST